MTGRMTVGGDLVDLRGANRMYRSLIVRNDLYAGGVGEIERYEGGLAEWCRSFESFFASWQEGDILRCSLRGSSSGFHSLNHVSHS